MRGLRGSHIPQRCFGMLLYQDEATLNFCLSNVLRFRPTVENWVPASSFAICIIKGRIRWPVSYREQSCDLENAVSVSA